MTALYSASADVVSDGSHKFQSTHDEKPSSAKQRQKRRRPRLDLSRQGLDPAQNYFHAPLVHHERYSFDDWPEQHTFPMDKFARIAHALQTTCKRTLASSPLPRPLVACPNDFFRPLDWADIPVHDWLCGPIDEDFVHRFLLGQLTVDECRTIGFREQTARPELVERTVLEVAGTVLTAQLALTYGIAANTAGGTHHAHPQGGAGYTILNDLAVTTHVLTADPKTYGVKRVLTIDCDVHQGDGTAKFGAQSSLLQGKLFTLSLHCESNYPFDKAQSTFDVGLPDGMQDEAYLQVLRESVELALDQVQPDLVLYDAGVDIYQHDRLGRLDISEAGIRQRDRFVMDTCVTRGIPVAAVVGGGYDKDVDALARRHALVHEEAAYVWRKHKLWQRVSERQDDDDDDDDNNS